MRETSVFSWPVGAELWRDVRLPFLRSTDVVPPLIAARVPTAGALPLPSEPLAALMWRSLPRTRLLELALVPDESEEACAIRLELPGPLTAAPILDSASSPNDLALFIAVAPAFVCHVRLRTVLPISDLDAQYLLSKAEVRLPSPVTAMQTFGPGKIAIGTDDATVGQISFDGLGMTLTTFSAPEQHADPGSAASTAAPSFLNRFKARRQGVTTNTPVRPNQVQAIATVPDTFILTVDTHATLCLWSRSPNSLSFALQQTFNSPFSLAKPDTTTANPSPVAFLSAMSGPHNFTTFYFTAMADENRFRPSLRIFRLDISNSPAANAELTEVVEISGDKIKTNVVGALPIGDKDFVVALRNGKILRFPTRTNNKISGIDEVNAVHSALDEITDPDPTTSLWGLLDVLVPDQVHVRLFAPSRFSKEVILRALRRPDAEFYSHDHLTQVAEDVIEAQMQSGRSRVDALSSLVSRATRLASEVDMPVASFAALGPVTSEFLIVRQARVSIMRQRIYPEQEVFNAISGDSMPAFVWQQVPVAILQVTGAGCLDARQHDNEAAFAHFRDAIVCACTPSERNPQLNMVDIATKHLATEEPVQLTDAITRVTDALIPGPDSLVFLNEQRECDQLGKAAAQVTESFPCSANFAVGIAALEKARSCRNVELHDTLLFDTFAVGLNAITERSNQSDLDTLARMIGRNDATQGYLRFWCREHIVRLYQAANAPSLAAMGAMDAISHARDRKEYEMMRSAAFNFFLEATNCEGALSSLMLTRSTDDETGLSAEEQSKDAAALRDAISLLVAAAADQGRMDWLSEKLSSSPSKMSLVAWSLQKRAATADLSSATRFSLGGPYEDLYAWLMVCGNSASAAAVALEWAQRLEEEAAGGRIPALLFVRSRTHALAAACAALATVPESMRWISCFPDSIVPHGEYNNLDMEVEEELADPWALVDQVEVSHGRYGGKELRRWLLLSQAQLGIVERLAEEDRNLTKGACGPLDSSSAALEWCIGSLCKLKEFHSASEVAMAWGDTKPGEHLLRRIVFTVGSTCAEMNSIAYELESLVESINSWRQRLDTDCTGIHHKNYFFDFAEGYLGASGGRIKPPKWLINACAWNTRQIREGSDGVDKGTAGTGGAGDLAGTARLLLRFGRAVDAGEVLLEGLVGLGNGEDGKQVCMPYVLVDATLDRLEHGESDSEGLAAELRSAAFRHLRECGENDR